MAYPASEVIANTIAEAINNADKMSGWDYVSFGISAIAAVAPFLLLFWEIRKSRKERERQNAEKKELEDKLNNEREKLKDTQTLKEIQLDYDEIVEILFSGRQALNIRDNWNEFHQRLMTLKSIEFLSSKQAQEEFKRNSLRIQNKLKKLLNEADPDYTSLRFQFFTGANDWKTSNDTWEEIEKKINIGTATSEPNIFGNYYKKDSMKNICPFKAIAIYHFANTGEILGSEDNTNLEKFRKNEDIISSRDKWNLADTIFDVTPKWLQNTNDHFPYGLIVYIKQYMNKFSFK